MYYFPFYTDILFQTDRIGLSPQGQISPAFIPPNICISYRWWPRGVPGDQGFCKKYLHVWETILLKKLK
ncbi:MAG: hypothetical protein DSY89_03345 [Deltaproteobacteria bacterium]|nr:MAG: hypothetical protein DSY89_03345 [Deltaproteobacteria bacterium]